MRDGAASAEDIERIKIQRVRDDNLEPPVDLPQRQNVVLGHQIFGNHVDDRGADHILLEIDVFHVELRGQSLGDVFFAAQLHLDQGLTYAPTVFGRVLHGTGHRLGRHHAPAHQQLTQLLFPLCH